MKPRMATSRTAGALCLLFAALRPAGANDIAVSSVALWNQNVAASNVYVDFTVAWSHSWRDDVNWDAAWIFVKYRAPGDPVWRHATLSTNASDHLAAAGSVIKPAPDGKGAFVYQASPGSQSGGVSFPRTRLRWDYGAADGTNYALNAQVEVAVHALEMVYVPQGSFYIGSVSGASDTSPFYLYPSATTPYLLTGEAQIAVGAVNGNLYYASSTYGGDRLGPVPAAFPKGYNGFYCMKYEVTQGQWVDFFNSLADGQRTNRDITASFNGGKGQDGPYYSNTVSWTCPPDPTNTAATCTMPDRGCNFLAWCDLCAYLDWAALRPMTELEFERISRGPLYPVANEYAWGNTTLVQMTNELGSGGAVTPNPANANCNYGNVASMQGPTRAGIFATATSTRPQSGAGYYGAMEMSGSVWERPVTVGHPTGRAFQGTYGDGVLSANGNGNNADWPGYSGGEIVPTTANGTGLRGGAWGGNAVRQQLAQRLYAAVGGTPGDRGNENGGRGVRSAP